MGRTRSKRVLRNRGSVVERAIGLFDDNAAEFQRRLEKISGMEFSRPQIHYWRVRGQFPPEVVPYVQALTRIPWADLLQRPSPRGGKR